MDRYQPLPEPRALWLGANRRLRRWLVARNSETLHDQRTARHRTDGLADFPSARHQRQLRLAAQSTRARAFEFHAARPRCVGHGAGDTADPDGFLYAIEYGGYFLPLDKDLECNLDKSKITTPSSS